MKKRALYWINRHPFSPLKLLALDGDNKNTHGNEKEQMPQLMHKNAFRCTVHLGGMGRVGQQYHQLRDHPWQDRHGLNFYE